MHATDVNTKVGKLVAHAPHFVFSTIQVEDKKVEASVQFVGDVGITVVAGDIAQFGATVFLLFQFLDAGAQLGNERGLSGVVVVEESEEEEDVEETEDEKKVEGGVFHVHLGKSVAKGNQNVAGDGEGEEVLVFVVDCW